MDLSITNHVSSDPPGTSNTAERGGEERGEMEAGPRPGQQAEHPAQDGAGGVGVDRMASVNQALVEQLLSLLR